MRNRDAILGSFTFVVFFTPVSSAEATYVPAMGRWLQRDPIGYEGGSINLFEFVNGDPIGYVDPMGLSPQEVRKRLKALCAEQICPQKALGKARQPSGLVCETSDTKTYNNCKRDCEAEADKLVDCIEKAVNSANRGRGAVCTNINPYIEKLVSEIPPNHFRVEAFRPIRTRDGRPGRHVVTGIGPRRNDNYPVIVDPLDWNNLFPPNLVVMILEPNTNGKLEDHLPSQKGEPHEPLGPRFQPRDPPPWKNNSGIFPP